MACIKQFLMTLLCATVVVHAAAQVTVTGANSVGVNQMIGSTIQLGLSPKEAKALVDAAGQSQITKLQALVARLNAQQNKQTGQADYSLGVVQGFLATIKGKLVPQNEWPVVFGELSRQYLEIGLRIQATPVTSDAIKKLVSEADTARKAGLFERADTLLAQASDLALLDAQALEKQSRESTRQAASLFVTRALVAFTRLERAQGAALLEKAFDLRRHDLDLDVFLWLINSGDAWTLAGQSARALSVFEKAKLTATEMSTSDPGKTEWQRNLFISHSKIGDMQQARGYLDAATGSFQAALAIAQKLAASDPSNRQWQRDLFVSYDRIGYMQQTQGDRDASLRSYRTALAIAQKLSTSDPGSTQWQRDLAVCYERIGDVQQALDGRDATLGSYLAGMAIRQKLVNSDPGNTEWQRDLSISHDKIGDMQQVQGNLEAANESYQASLAIRQKLATSDPANIQWQRDLSLSNNMIGHIQQAQGNLDAANKSYRAGLAIAQKIAASDPGNTDWQRDLIVSYWSMSEVEGVDGKNVWLQKGLRILQTQREQGQLPVADLGWLKRFEDASNTLGQ